METQHKLVIGFLSFLIISSCSLTDKSNRGFKISVQAGLNKGGITENTDLKVVPNAEPAGDAKIDAYTGATRISVNAGMHVNKPLKYGEIEFGLDYMQNNQTFTYADQNNMYNGVRKLSVNQVMIPLTYNFVLFKKFLPLAEIQLKLGYMVQVNFVSTNGTGILPEYSINKWSNGAVFGISVYPFKFGNGSKLGIYIDAYRGSQVYLDYYNQKSFKMPGSSFVKGGLRYRFK